MLPRKGNGQAAQKLSASATAIWIQTEALENRVLFHHGGFGGDGGLGGGCGGGGMGGGGFGGQLTTIEFSQAPSAVQSGLDTLATNAGLADPSATTNVQLGNRNGVETYSVDITGTGTNAVLTVDENGNPVTAPTNGTVTYSSVPAAVSTEASAIATALNLSVPASTANVKVTTPSGGTAVYQIDFTSSSTSSSGHSHGRVISIDANGNPVGNASLPFSVMPTTIQNALNANAPTGATALTSTSTQNVRIATIDGVTTYSTTFTSSGTSTTVTVNSAGTLTTLPTHTTTTFSTLTSTVQNAINTLAGDEGATTPIAGTTTVDVYTEIGGTTIYSVTVSASKTGSSSTTMTYNLTISVDQNGNPTTLPDGSIFGASFGGFSGYSVLGGAGFFGESTRHRRG